MFDDILHVRVLHRIGNVPEVGTVRNIVFFGCVGHVLHERVVLTQDRPELLHTQLVVVGHVDVPDFVELQQRLLLGEHQLEEVLVDHIHRRHIELHCTENECKQKATYGFRRST